MVIILTTFAVALIDGLIVIPEIQEAQKPSNFIRVQGINEHKETCYFLRARGVRLIKKMSMPAGWSQGRAGADLDGGAVITISLTQEELEQQSRLQNVMSLTACLIVFSS